MSSLSALRRAPVLFPLLFVAVIAAFFADVAFGPVVLSWKEIWTALTEGMNGAGDAAASSLIVWEFRLPRAVAALCAGAGLGVAGFLLQTQFRNPLAGPAELGVSSGAGLGVAALLLIEPLLPAALLNGLGPWPLAAAAALGAGATMALVMLLSARLWDSASLLLAGLMIASACGAVISLMQYFSEAAQLKAYAIWGFGGLGGVTWAQNGVLALGTALGLIVAWALSRPLYAALLGDSAAASLGIPVRRFRLVTLAAASLLSGVVTAFCGPVAFVGLAVPHLARFCVRGSDPRLVQPACMLLGAALLLICDSLSHFPGRDAILPLNAVTSLFGAPTVLYFLLRRSRSSL
jgi:iron complex transport system permease protein